MKEATYNNAPAPHKATLSVKNVRRTAFLSAFAFSFLVWTVIGYIVF